MMKREVLRTFAENHCSNIIERLDPSTLHEFHTLSYPATPHFYWKYLSDRLRTCAQYMDWRDAIRAFATHTLFKVEKAGLEWKGVTFSSTVLREGLHEKLMRRGVRSVSGYTLSLVARCVWVEIDGNLFELEPNLRVQTDHEDLLLPLSSLADIEQVKAEVNSATREAAQASIVQPWGDATQPALMLTGLAGTGKTQLMQAMKRFLGDRVGRVDLPGHRNLEIQPAWFLSLRDGNTLNSLLGPWVVPDRADCDRAECDGAEIPRRKDLKQSQLLQLARLVSRRDGVCIIFLDEFQFITRSQNANTLAMTLLLQLLSVGPRVVYVANFSLARRLMNRHQEDRHRVLANHLELQPDAVDGSDFLNYITELTRIVPEDFRFETSSIAGLLHRYSYGIKRAVMELLVGAWAHAKAHRGARADVTESDVKAAYASSG